MSQRTPRDAAHQVGVPTARLREREVFESTDTGLLHAIVERSLRNNATCETVFSRPLSHDSMTEGP
jgi:hypothetical protein